MSRGLGGNASCLAPDPRLAALLDGELPPAEQQQLEQHLASCARCSADLAQQRLARFALRQAAERMQPPRALETEIRHRLREASPAASHGRRLALIAGIAAVFAVLVLAGVFVWSGNAGTDALLRRAVQAHQAETLGTAAVSFASSDPAAVTAWAERQTGRSVDVPSLDAAGYRLLGARVDSSVGTNAIALVYEGGEGRMTCTILPPSKFAPDVGDVRVRVIDGLAAASWSDDDSTYVMVANLDAAMLLQLAHQVQQTAF